jgi:DNA (cytosine-5)-methyltransferase 1
MLHKSNTAFTSFIPDPAHQMRQLALGMAVRSRTDGGEIVVDNFAAGGGASEGIRQAMQELGWCSYDDQLGTIPWDVDIAINHDGEALVMHTANHPNTAHYQEDVFDVHPGFITGQRPIGLAWFSPDCKHHSKAKGGKPRDQKIRGLAWVVLKWGAMQAPRCIVIENVVEFQTWGPLDEHGKPIKNEAGRTFRAFIDALSTGLSPDHPDVPEIYATLGADFPMERLYAGLGYDVEYRVIRAADLGVPTLRTRLFIFARRDGEPICWPEITHGDPKRKGFAESGLLPERTAADDCIDFRLEAKSIFGRSRPLAANTERRIAKGLWRHVLSNADPFIVNAEGLTRAGEPVGVSKRKGAAATEHRRQPETPVVTPFLTEHANASNQRTMVADEPLRTVCAQVKGGHFSLVSPVMVPLRGTSEAHLCGDSVAEPVSTISAQGTHHGLACAHLVSIGYGERAGQRERTSDVRRPVGTAVTANKHAVSVAQLEPAAGIQIAHLAHLTHHGDRPGTPLTSPVPTVTGAHRGEQAIVAAYLEQANGGFYAGEGRSLVSPMSSVTSSGAQQQLINVYLVRYAEGGEEQPFATNGVSFATVPRSPLSVAQEAKARMCADLLRRHMPDQFAEPAEMVLVWIRGQWWILVDITLRMLTPRELARAQGFPDSYVIEPMVRRLVRGRGGKGRRADRWEMVPLSKTAQVRMIGNSVCPPVAKALVLANFRRSTALPKSLPPVRSSHPAGLAQAA